MTIRIWHQSHTVLEDVPDYAATLKRHVDKVKGADTEVVMNGMKPGTFTTEYPGKDLAYTALYTMHNVQWLVNAVRAERGGFDAYAMATFPNPRIEVARTLVDIPVTGYGEGCAHLACMYGRRFGVLNFIPEAVVLYQSQLEGYGLGQRLAGVRQAGVTFNEVAAGFREPGPVIDKFLETARGFIRDTGCDVIIPGEMVLNVFLIDNGITRVDDVPLIDGMGAVVKLTEMMVELRRLSGMEASRHGFFNARPPAGRFEEICRFYGLEGLLDPD